MKSFLCSLALLFMAGAGFSQSYFSAAGIRLGTDWGLTVQQRIARKTTIEGILQSSLFREEGMLTVMVEQHSPLISRRFNVYGGGGLHTGWRTVKPAGGAEDTDPKGPFGITLIGGAEMTIGRLNLSYDFKPAINITGGEQTFYTQSGISARYVIVKKPFWEQNKKGRNKARNKKRKNSGRGLRFW